MMNRNTSDPRRNTDGDTWDDGDIDEENPVYDILKKKTLLGSPPARAGTKFASEEVFKDQNLIVFGPPGEAYVGLQIDAYINETQGSSFI